MDGLLLETQQAITNLKYQRFLSALFKNGKRRWKQSVYPTYRLLISPRLEFELDNMDQRHFSSIYQAKY